MATSLQNIFEGGTLSTAVTTGNSGGASGDAFTHVIVGSGGSIEYDTMPWSGGGKGAKVTFGSTATYLRWDDGAVDVGDTRRVARRPVWLTGEPTSNFELAHVYLDGGTRLGALMIYGTNDATHKGKLAIIDGTATTLTASRSTDPLSTNTLYWVEFAVKSGSGATGELSWRLLAADGVTEIESYVNTTATTNADNPARVRFGHNGAAGLAADYLDDVQFSPVPTGWLGPIGTTEVLDTPVLTLDSKTPASSISATDGTATVSWDAVDDADHYEALIAPHGTTAYTSVEEPVTSPYTFEDLPAGGIRLAIRAKAE